MTYTVKDYYCNHFGEAVYVTDSLEDAVSMCDAINIVTEGDSKLSIVNNQTGSRIDFYEK